MSSPRIMDGSLEVTRSDENLKGVSMVSSVPSQPIDIPIDILHLIITATDPLRSSHPRAFKKRTPGALETQKACSLVCWRWREVALQYVFSKISILMDVLDQETLFFQHTPWVAKHVKELTLRATYVQISALDSLFRTLPSLRNLDMTGSVVVGSPGADLQVDSSRVLQQLRFYVSQGGKRPLFQCDSIKRLLRLFSIITYLDLGFGPDTSDTAVNGASVILRVDCTSSTTWDSIRALRIHRLRANGKTTLGLFVPEFLHRDRTDALKDLTSLSFFLTKSSLKIISNVLGVVHTTLERVDLSWCEWHDGFRTGECSAGIEKSLSQCRRLSNVELWVILRRREGQYARLSGGQVYRRTEGEQEGWCQLLQFLNVVSPDHLRSVKLNLYGLVVDPHILDWGRLNEWCSRASCLESIKVSFHPSYNQTGCLAYEMQSFLHIFRVKYRPPLSPTAVDDLSLDTDLVNEDELKCEHDGCLRYHANKQSSKP